jgi:hypothetical protein
MGNFTSSLATSSLGREKFFKTHNLPALSNPLAPPLPFTHLFLRLIDEATQLTLPNEILSFPTLYICNKIVFSEGIRLTYYATIFPNLSTTNKLPKHK